MLPLVLVLLLIAVALTLASVSGRVPLWPAVFVICLLELVQLWPR